MVFKTRRQLLTHKPRHIDANYIICSVPGCGHRMYKNDRFQHFKSMHTFEVREIFHWTKMQFNQNYFLSPKSVRPALVHFAIMSCSVNINTKSTIPTSAPVVILVYWKEPRKRTITNAVWSMKLWKRLSLKHHTSALCHLAINHTAHPSCCDVTLKSNINQLSKMTLEWIWLAKGVQRDSIISENLISKLKFNFYLSIFV